MVNPKIQYRYPTSPTREEDQFHVFPVMVTSVDHERMCLTCQDMRTGIIYTDVKAFPANASGIETSDIQMPEERAVGIAANMRSRAGFMDVAILSWIPVGTLNGLQAVAQRPSNEVEGMNLRARSTYRKATVGQKTVSNTLGYSERIDAGWDRTSADFSRDKIDALTRTWSQLTGNKVSYSDSGLSVKGAINRPNAVGVIPVVIPDGSKTHYPVFLNPTAAYSDRYTKGTQDVIPLSESRELVQEFALDFPVPLEALGTPLMDTFLGSTANPWTRTAVVTTGNISHDDQSYSIDQTWDHPTKKTVAAVGPTNSEGITPRRRAYIIEKTQGTLVGYSQFDPTTYGKVLKPVLFPYTTQGRFAVDVTSSYLPTVASSDNVETRLAASAMAIRFPHEYNTTRIDITKEGFTSFEIGSTLPKENIPLAGGYEHPHGAGRSLEGHAVGSVKLVVGKNRDEEEALDFSALGQVVMRLGADDASLPNERRNVMTQQRGAADAVTQRTLQYWAASKLIPGDAGSLTMKTGAENISLRAAFDGGTVVRFGARNVNSKRRHLINGYQDAPGTIPWGVNDSSRVDSKTSGRPTYGAGDSLYAFHNLANAGAPVAKMLPYNWSGTPIPTTMDAHGLSIDFHTVRDILLRVGANPASGQSVLMDLAGGLVAWFGKDQQGRSLTATLDGGIEMVIGMNDQQKGLRLEITGDVDITTKGNVHWNVTGDFVLGCTSYVCNAKTDHITTSQNTTSMALVSHVIESPATVSNQGLYTSSEDGD